MSRFRRVLLVCFAAVIVPACEGPGGPFPPPQTIRARTGGGSVGGGGGIISSPEIAFLASKNVAGVNELFVTDLAGTEIANLSGPLVIGGAVRQYQWSPDRKWIAFVADKETDERRELYVVPSGGGQPTKVSPPISGGTGVHPDFAWAPDSSRIAFLAPLTFYGKAVLYTSSTAGNPIDVSGPMVARGGVYTRSFYYGQRDDAVFAWSPDGSLLCYLADKETDEVVELYTVRPDGTGTLKVSGPLGPAQDVRWFAWAPDGSRIAYMADQDTAGTVELYTVRSAGTGGVKISGTLSGARYVEDFGWSPDSGRVAYYTFPAGGGRYELNVGSADGSGSVFISGTDGDNILLASHWAPDGSRIAFTSYAGGKPELYTSLPDGTGIVKVSGPSVTPFPNGLLSYVPFLWSPDSSRLLYLADQETDNIMELFVSLATTAVGNVKVSGLLTPGGQVGFSFWWSPDGSRVLYVADKDADEVFNLYSSMPDGTLNTVLSGPLVAGGDVLTYFGMRPCGFDPLRAAYVADEERDQAFELYVTPIAGSGSSKVSGSLVPRGAVVSFRLK